jgi:hypothetical protein
MGHQACRWLPLGWVRSHLRLRLNCRRPPGRIHGRRSTAGLARVGGLLSKLCDSCPCTMLMNTEKSGSSDATCR